MIERDLRALIDDLGEGRLSRRVFVRRIVALGLGAPLAAAGR